MVVKPVNVAVLLLFLPAIVFCAGRGSRCTTPNKEEATCTALTNCKVIFDALRNNQDPKVVEFARTSQCGYDNEPLVCCGSSASKIESERGTACRTPNQESATCRPLSTCNVIKDSILSGNEAAADFARQSQCGYDTEPLVCCGQKDFTYLKNISPLLPDRSICGFERDENRVFGGELTDIGEYPWMALLRYKFRNGDDAGFKCGGSLINNRYVLTAAHCVIISSFSEFDLDIVRLGEWRISTTKDCEEIQLASPECADPVVDLNVERRIPHPNYDRKSSKNDIALIRLERNVRYTEYIRAICLPFAEASSPVAGSVLIVAGWGATENSSASDYKLKVKVPLVSLTECGEKIKRRGSVTEDQLCAGGVPGKDSCQGDSGGPLMKQTQIDNQRNQWYQEGIVSWGVSCGVTGFPGIYTRVAKYMDWILNNMSRF